MQVKEAEITPTLRNGAMGLLMLSSALGFNEGLIDRMVRLNRKKPEHECALPACKNLTTHNGGYCCAEHCHEHRRIRKESKA